jgi:signal transduction histidine kinase/ligand-binding sensor domain-containing protein
MSRVYIWVILLSFQSVLLKAQAPFYATRSYTVIQGLPQSQVTSLLEDQSGYLWVGTHGGGLARFDGREFKVYTTLDGLLTNQVGAIHLDKHNTIWVLHARGVTKFNGREFKRIEAPTTAPSSAKTMWRMFNVNDTLYVLSDRDRISKLHGDSIYYWEKPLPMALERMHIGPRGEACFYMEDKSFFIKLPNKTISFKPDLPLDGVVNFFNYKNDILFKANGGVYRLDIPGKKVTRLTWSTENYVKSYDEKEDVLWTCSATDVLREKFIDGHPKADTILRDIEVSQILRDSEGNTWIATNGDGLYKYFVQDFRRFNSENIRGVMSVARDHDGSLWLGTMYKGLWKLKDGKATSYASETEPNKSSFGTVKVSPTGEVWIGTTGRLGRYDKASDTFRWFPTTDGLSQRPIMSIEFAENGMWIAGGAELGFFDGQSFKTYNQKNGFDEGRILTLYYYKPLNTLYIGTSSRLLALRDGVFKPIHIAGLGNACVLGLQPYKNLLVMATTGGGVVVFNPVTHQSKLITTREGLPSDIIYLAGVDEKDNLWVGSEKGINRIRLDNNFEMIENLHFNDDNGLMGVETNHNAFYLSPKEKYFGLVDGLYEFNHAMDENPTSFDLHLCDVQILYGEYSAREYADSTFGFFRIPYKPQLPPDKNHLTFSFNRVDKRYSKSVKYKYFLENFDKKWSQPSSMNSVTYSNLPPGDYVFRVMVTNNKGSWADSKIAYPFTIKAPFYQTASFIIGTIILLAGVVTLIFYFRVKQRIDRAMMLERIRQREQEAVRKEIARDFHDEMGNQLTRIINYISLLKLNGHGQLNGNGNGTGKHTGDLYSKVEDSAKYLYSGTRDFIWSIDPVNDELSKLFLHVRDFGEKLFEEKGISFRAFNEVKESIKLPYGFCRQANLIFKEAMTNAFKYSEAKNVTLSLKRDGEEGFEMSFEDDGKGFYTGEIQKMNGLQNIRERADRINAQLRIHSEKNVGTKIFLNFKPTKTLKYGVTI